MVSLPSRMLPLRTAADRAHAVQRIASRRRRDDGDGQRAHMPPLIKYTPAHSLGTKDDSLSEK
mgnify:CR=1 FL=1